MITQSTYKLLKAIRDKPGQSLTKVSKRANIVFSTATHLFNDLKPCKIFNIEFKTKREMMLSLNEKGLKLLDHYEAIELLLVSL